ncbi:efflux RND transporter periplasmic adaptor subunit [Shewanella sp. MEBiC00475]|uniref:efflux RND transporter periplasmic adaptor subunit n=1 Tax=Shewanella sp. MEBiC00475 TaxID=2575361 RepID=UPI0010C0A41A|nr:biotin/lipoyl-binding protein [Shewanella sp. MEBiC00475]
MKIISIKTIVSLLIVIALIIAGVTIISHKKTAMQSIPPAKTYGLVVPVNTASISTVVLTLPYLAEVQSDSNVDLASKVTSRVKMIVTSGTNVKRGDLLAELDAGDLLAQKKSLEFKIAEMGNQIKAKQADLKSLQISYKRNTKLLDIQAVSQDKIDTDNANIESMESTIAGMKNNVAALKQNIREIDDNLSYTSIKSPIDGVVSKTFIAEGGIATGGKSLLSLSGGNTKRLLVRVSDKVIPSAVIYQQQNCPVHSLNSTDNGLNEYSCQLQTTVSAGNRVEVKLIVYRGKNILLPTNAVLQKNGKQYVLLVEGDTAVAHQVTIIAEGSEGLLVDGIKAGDEYVVAKPDILLKLLTGISIIRANS